MGTRDYGGGKEDGEQLRNSPNDLKSGTWHQGLASYLLPDTTARTRAFPASSGERLSPFSFPPIISTHYFTCISLYQRHIQENQPPSIRDWVNLQANLLTSLPESSICSSLGRGQKWRKGQVPFLMFYISILRFQDTWKGFAPFLLIGYRPWESLLVHVLYFPSPLGFVSTSGYELGVSYTIQKYWRNGLSQGWVLGCNIWCYTHKLNYCQSNELCMTTFD